jgi:hypothetical protein
MKRLHLHVAVDDLAKSTLFGATPTVVKADYAKWRIEDPRVNFAISRRGAKAGLDHLGIEADSAEELAGIAARLAAAGERLTEEKATTCCYARSDKAWVADPEGIAWETFHTFGESTVYGEERQVLPAATEVDTTPRSACCGPAATTSPVTARAACC